MDPKRKRCENWTSEEKEILTQLVGESAKIIENKTNKTQVNVQKFKEWKAIASRFNTITGRQRTDADLKNAWKRMKLTAKSNFSAHRRENFKTGGGDKPPSPTPEDQKIMAIAPHEFVSDVNEFDSDGIQVIYIEPTSQSSTSQQCTQPYTSHTQPSTSQQYTQPYTSHTQPSTSQKCTQPYTSHTQPSTSQQCTQPYTFHTQPSTSQQYTQPYTSHTQPSTSQQCTQPYTSHTQPSTSQQHIPPYTSEQPSTSEQPFKKKAKNVKSVSTKFQDALVNSNIDFKTRHLAMLEEQHNFNIKIAKLKIQKLELEIELLTMNHGKNDKE